MTTNLQDLRRRGAYYLVGTPRRKLANFERELLKGDWQEIAGKPGVRVQLLSEGAETFVLARSLQRAKSPPCCEVSSRLSPLSGRSESYRKLVSRPASSALATNTARWSSSCAASS